MPWPRIVTTSYVVVSCVVLNESEYHMHYACSFRANIVRVCFEAVCCVILKYSSMRWGGLGL